MVLLRDEWLIPIGSMCLAIAILADRFLTIESSILDFIIGMLTGISIVLNLIGLVRIRKEQH